MFRGTRVPVYLIADMIEQETPLDEILEGYPSLTRAMAEYCPYLRGNAPEAWPAAGSALVQQRTSGPEKGQAAPCRVESSC